MKLNINPEEAENLMKQWEAEDKWKSYSHIYVIKADKYYKIGRAYNVYQRLNCIKVDNPFETNLILAGKVKDVKEVEKKLHNLFKDKHQRGEWFLLTKDDLYIIKDILEQEQIALQNIVYGKEDIKTENSD